MARWLDQAEQLTYEGEDVTETVEVDTGGVVVTTHRVLVFSPEDDGEAFSHVDLPNVETVETIQAGERDHLETAAKAGIVGVVLLVAGAVLPLDSLVGDVSFGRGAGRIGIGGIVGAMEQMLAVLESLDTVLLVLGAIALLVASGAMGWYLQTRERRLRIDRAGDDPLTLTLGDETVTDATLERLRRAIRPAPH